MTIIPAQATLDHAEHFARLAQIASDEFFTELLGNRGQVALRSMFLRAENDFSHTHCAFLQAGDSVAGMIHAYSAEQAAANAQRSTWLIMRYAGWQILRCLVVGYALRNILEFLGADLASGDFYIAMVALYPPYRGRGHSKTLIERTRELAIGQGCSRLSLDVDERNHIAIAAYQRTGFTKIAESKKIKHAGELWGLLRMAKPLE